MTLQEVATMSTRIRLAMVTLAVLLLSIGTVGVTAAAEPQGISALAATTRKIALGVSMKEDRDLATFRAFASSAGRAPAIWSIWSDWGGSDAAFPPTALLQGLKDRGSVPMIIWQPVDPAHVDRGDFSYSTIIAGAHDAYLRTWARAADAWGGTVLLRLAHEMNGYWFPWGMTRFDNTPKRFKKAWRHIYDIVRVQEGATNVKFVWSPYAPCAACASYASLYPGDSYVQYAAFSAFNWGSPRPWKSMVKSFSRPMREITSVTRKKVIVTETGSSALGGDKAAWIRDGYPAVYKAFPKIKGIVYFDLDMRPVDQPNWLLTAPAGALDAYRAIAARTKFQGVFR